MLKIVDVAMGMALRGATPGGLFAVGFGILILISLLMFIVIMFINNDITLHTAGGYGSGEGRVYPLWGRPVSLGAWVKGIGV